MDSKPHPEYLSTATLRANNYITVEIPLPRCHVFSGNQTCAKNKTNRFGFLFHDTLRSKHIFNLGTIPSGKITNILSTINLVYAYPKKKSCHICTIPHIYIYICVYIYIYVVSINMSWRVLLESNP